MQAVADPLFSIFWLSWAWKHQGLILAKMWAGTESTDGYSGVMPQMMSEMLDVPCLSFARKVEASDGIVTIERQTSGGYDVVTAPTPALVTVTSSIEPRYPTFKGIMQAKSKPVTTLTAAELDVENTQRQTIRNVEAVEARDAGEVVVDEGEAYARIVEILEQLKVI